MPRPSLRRGRSAGVAAVELAVCLPVIVLLVFAAIETCSMIFVTQAMHAAAYEGARLAVRQSSETAEVVSLSERVLDGHGIIGAAVSCEPSDIATVESGDLITIVVTASCETNRVSPAFIFAGQNLEVRTTMAKE